MGEPGDGDLRSPEGRRSALRSRATAALGWALAALLAGAGPLAAAQEPPAEREPEPPADSATGAPAEPAEPSPERHGLRFRVEAKAAYRDSEALRLPSPYPFTPEMLPVGATQAWLETVDPGEHFEIPVLTFWVDGAWGESLAARAKVDVIDLWDRNPTSSDKEVDVDELWLRFGRDGRTVESTSAYLKLGKFPKFERQEDRHLESYGLVSTAFNRFEDQGLELGLQLGRHLYLRGSYTQGNPLFYRDPNALAGDHGTPELEPGKVNPVPELATGFPVLYDAEVEELDAGEPETGAGIGLRFGGAEQRWRLDLLAWGYRRDLADTVDLEGTFYGGDLDLLNGPGNAFGLPIRGREKQEVGGNLAFEVGGLSFFAQYVDQEVAGMKRVGYEGELAWRIELPLVWAVAERQLFPFIAPAVRYSELDPEFEGGSPKFPAPSVRWDWTKLDYGLRLGIVEGIDLTVEYADNTLTLLNGREVSEDELLATLRWRM